MSRTRFRQNERSLVPSRLRLVLAGRDGAAPARAAESFRTSRRRSPVGWAGLGLLERVRREVEERQDEMLIRSSVHLMQFVLKSLPPFVMEVTRSSETCATSGTVEKSSVTQSELGAGAAAIRKPMFAEMHSKGIISLTNRTPSSF